MELVVGRVGRAHGIGGEVAVEVRTDVPELRFAGGAELAAADRTLTVSSARPHRGRLLVKFAELDDREAAERVRGQHLVAEVPDDERTDDPEEYFDHQLIGLAAIVVGGEPIGTVTEIAHLPMQDLLVIRTVDGVEVFVPFVASIVPEVDLDGRRLVVDPPAGLLPSSDDRAGSDGPGEDGDADGVT